MAYSPNIPQASDVPATSQAQLLANFQALQTYLSLNHDNIVGGTGKHKQVTLPVLAADPTAAAGEMVIFTKNVAGIPNLFLKPQGAGVVVNMLPTIGGNAAYGCMFLGDLKMLWGSSATAGGTVTIDISAAPAINWPGFINPPTVQITRVTPSNTTAHHNTILRDGSVTNLQFIVKSVDTTTAAIGGAAGFTFLAIGI